MGRHSCLSVGPHIFLGRRNVAHRDAATYGSYSRLTTIGSSLSPGLMSTCGSEASVRAKSSTETDAGNSLAPGQVEAELHHAVAVADEVGVPEIVEDHGQHAVHLLRRIASRGPASAGPPKVTSGASRLTHSQWPAGVA